MDLSVITPAQSRVGPSDSRTSRSDFADELNKEATKQGAHPSDARGSEAEASSNGERVGSPMEADGPQQMFSQGDHSNSTPAVVSAVSAPPEVGVMTSDRILSARVFGLHLQGAAYLSEYSRASEAHANRSEGATEGGGAKFGPLLPADSIEASAGVTGADSEPGEVYCVASPSVPVDSRIESDNGDATESSRQISGMGAWSAEYWPDRSLKLTPRSDGKNIVWLRDYTLSHDQARELAARIVVQMSGQGFAPHQVIWNGHEIWSSDESSKGN